MRPLRAWLIRFGALFGFRRRDREFEAELESHLELHIDDGVRAGLTRAEARRQALIKLGGVEPTRQTYGDRRGIRWIEQLVQDRRYGLRAMKLGTSWTAVLMLAALGASRRRLLMQAFVESAVIGAAGAGLGIALAAQRVGVAETLLPRSFLARSLYALQVDATAVAVASALAVVATLLAGLVPAWMSTRLDVSSSLRVVERGGTETRSARLLTRGFIVTEIALACALLVGGASPSYAPSRIISAV